MTRLIDADELLKYKDDHERISTHLIYNAPTVDAVPVIRCRDCKYCNPMRNIWRCTHPLVGMISEAEDYCSRAERKEG